jgi:CHAT domain-containing protein
LQVAEKRFIKINDLEAWQVSWHHSSPLLILNACDSADYSPDSFEDMIQAFFKHGAAGVIGTQCTIYESLVDTLMPLFLTAFLGQVPAGRALQQARRKRMWENQDPRGLTYSLFAAAELKLAAKVITGN